MKRLSLLGCLLVPVLAHADPLNNGALGVLGLFALAALGFVGLTLLAVVLAVLYPASRMLQITQGVLLAFFVFFSLTKYRELMLLLGAGVEAGLPAVVPLALFLNGVAQARQPHGPGASRIWTGLAVVGATGLLWVGIGLLRLDQLWLPDLQNAGLRTLWHLSLALPIHLIGWVLVLALLRRYSAPAAALWYPWWVTPAIAASLAVASYLANTLRLLSYAPGISLAWEALLPSTLLTATICWLAGVATLRVVRPPAKLPAAIA